MNKTFKKIVSAVLVILMCMTAAPLDGFVGLDLGLDFTASAAQLQTGKVGENIFYEFDTTTGEVSLTGTGEMYNYSPFSSGKSPFYQNKNVKSVTIVEGVENIGNYLFGSCSNLDSLTIPSTVKEIRSDAFYGCKLTTLVIPGTVETIGDRAFQSCEITNLTISDGVKTIGKQAFDNNDNLETINIPKSVESIGDYAFANCDKLQSITVDANNEYYASADGVFFDKAMTELIQYPTTKTTENYTVPESVKTIAGSAFYKNKNIKSVTMADNVETIGTEAFRECDKLESVKLSNKLTAIPEYAFYSDSALTSIVIPEGVTTIGQYAFHNCTSLKTVTIPSTLTSVGNNAFSYLRYYNYLPLGLETVYYSGCAGQKGDFANITFGENNECIKDADIICIADHDFVVQHKDAACLEDGYDYKQCSLCKLYYASDADVKSIDGKSDTSDFATTATGHDFDDVVNTTDVSCTEDGVSIAYKQCKSCEKYFGKDADTTATDGADTNEAYIIKATGHEFFNIQDEDKEPDCCSGGWYAYKCCETCEKFFPANADKYAKGGVDEATSFIRSALGHDFDFVVWTKDVSCTVDGVSTAYKQCKSCKKYFDEDADTTATDGADTNEAYIIKATGHNFFVVYDKDIEPTCAYDGFYAFKQCLTCVDNFTLDADKYSTDGVDINEFIRPALGHDFEATVEVKDATCDEDGVSAAYKHCKTCNEYFDADAGERAELGEKTNEAYIIPALGHDFTGDINMDTDGKDGKHSYACINGCGEYGGTVAHTWDDGTVTTPATFNKEGLMSYYCECGATKTEPIAKISNQIGDNVFFTFDEETGALTITGTGKTYDYDNGDNCSPFEASEDIKSVTISDGVTGIGNRLFVYCYNIESVTLPDSIESIGSATFMACLSLKTLTLPSKLKTIGSFALAGTGFTSITIPASVTSIGEEAISGNSYMTEIIVSADNENYCSVDGVLFNKDKTTLICYPLAKSTEDYTVPETVTTISAGAFTYASKLKALRLPSGLKTIESEAFHPHDISDIYFDGTEEEWNNNVTVGEMNNLGDDYVTMHFKSAHNHDFTGEIKNNGDGTHSYKCTGCETYGTPVAHNAWDNGKVTTPATHLKEGVMTYTCACGETKTEPISKLKEHDYTTVNVVDPTCTEQGYTEHKCACGDSYKDTYVVAKGHHYENGKCTSCDVADPDYSDGNQSTSCSCICHNNNRFVQFIYKIVRWFWKIFKIHKSCDCGNIHY